MNKENEQPGYYDATYAVGDKPNWIDLADNDSLRQEIRKLRAEVRRLRDEVKLRRAKEANYRQWDNEWRQLADELVEVLADVLHIWMNPTTTRTIADTNAMVGRAVALLAKHAEIKRKK